jgi:hypothetical protein
MVHSPCNPLPVCLRWIVGLKRQWIAGLPSQSGNGLPVWFGRRIGQRLKVELVPVRRAPPSQLPPRVCGQDAPTSQFREVVTGLSLTLPKLFSDPRNTRVGVACSVPWCRGLPPRHSHVWGVDPWQDRPAGRSGPGSGWWGPWFSIPAPDLLGRVRPMVRYWCGCDHSARRQPPWGRSARSGRSSRRAGRPPSTASLAGS